MALAWTSREPEALHEVVARGLDVVRLADGADDRVEVVERGLEAFEDVGPIPGLLQVELGAPANDDLAPLDVVLQHGLDGQRLRLAVDERDDVGVEGHLQGGVLEEVVEDLARGGVPLALDDDAHAVAIGLIAQVGDAVDLAGLDQVGDLLEQRGLVDLVRDGRGHDGRAAGPSLLEGDLRLHHDATPAVGDTCRGWRRSPPIAPVTGLRRRS